MDQQRRIYLRSDQDLELAIRLLGSVTMIVAIIFAVVAYQSLSKKYPEEIRPWNNPVILLGTMLSFFVGLYGTYIAAFIIYGLVVIAYRCLDEWQDYLRGRENNTTAPAIILVGMTIISMEGQSTPTSLSSTNDSSSISLYSTDSSPTRSGGVAVEEPPPYLAPPSYPSTSHSSNDPPPNRSGGGVVEDPPPYVNVTLPSNRASISSNDSFQAHPSSNNHSPTRSGGVVVEAEEPPFYADVYVEVPPSYVVVEEPPFYADAEEPPSYVVTEELPFYADVKEPPSYVLVEEPAPYVNPPLYDELSN